MALVLLTTLLTCLGRATSFRLPKDLPQRTPTSRIGRRYGYILFFTILCTSLIAPYSVYALRSPRSMVDLTGLTWERTPRGIDAVISLSGPLKFQENRLQNPERVFLDLNHAKIRTGVQRNYGINHPLLKAIRVGQFDRETVRIVFDLGADHNRINAVFLEDPYRITVRIHNKIEKEETAHKPPAHTPDGLIPKDQWITDTDARLALARILSYDDATLDESLNAYRILLRQKPEDPLIVLEMARVLIRKGDTREAVSLAGSIQRTALNNPETLVALADLEASLGHAARCRDLYLEAIRRSDRPETIRLELADRMNMWGDFYGAERIYREHLHAHPQDREAALRLAALLRSQERFAESEGIYKQMLPKSPDSGEILMGLAQLKRLEKNFRTSEKYVDRLLERDPDNPQGLLLKADILFLQKRYEDALAIYSRLSKMPCCRVKGLIGMGKTYLEQGKDDLARPCFKKALGVDPQDIEARFYAVGSNTATSEDFVNALLRDKDLSAMTLERWARLYAMHGFNEIAIQCYNASIERDPDYFPSQIGLAEVLAIDHRYDPAGERFDALSQVFPGNRKILMGWARALGWGRQYNKSIALYDNIHDMAPADPVPQIEKARTAVWAKKMDQAFDAYKALVTPPVDAQLAQSLRPVAEVSGNPELIAAVNRLAENAAQGSVFQGFEAFNNELTNLKSSLSPDTNSQIDAIRARLYPAFAIQKAAYLEEESKRLTWNRRPTQAMDAYEELLAFSPGNQEAIFDYAQLQCALGLCNREETTYRRLLDMDKFHSLAGRAMKRLEIRRSPSLKLGQIYWSERGRDGLTEIDRYRTDLGVDVPIDCRFHLKLIGHHWVEHPSYTHDSYKANGFTLGVSGVLNPYIKGEAGWTKKIYRDGRFENTDTGYGRIWVNLKDYVTVGLGYDRTDELYNYFGIRQGIQADAWWLTLNSHITRRLELLGQARYLSYSDNNDGLHYMAGAGYSFTDHPRIFKVALTGEYRNTRKQDVYDYENGVLVDITHPYWTPKDYYAGAVTFEWYHDLSKLLFCGSQLHFYDLAVAVGTDTEHNPSIELRGEWHYEFLDHWTFSIKGLIHRSKLWDAEGVWADIKYQF